MRAFGLRDLGTLGNGLCGLGQAGLKQRLREPEPMAERAKKNVMTREFLAIVTESGEQMLLDDEIVRKYHLRAGLVSPFSNQPIVSVTREVPVEPLEKRAKGGARGKAGARKPSRRSRKRGTARGRSRPKGKKASRRKR